MVGKSLGHYEILEPLGAGGMGEVYRARDTKLERDVAIKVLPQDFATDQDRLARFEREAKLLASLNHANIAAIYGFEDSDGVRFIAMELVDGETLADRLATQGRIEVDEALEIARQIAEALEAAHENGVIHRDLKPASPLSGAWEPVEPYHVGDALRFAMTEAHRVPTPNPQLAAVIYVGLTDWRLDDWAHVEIKARTSDPKWIISVMFNYTEEDPLQPGAYPLYAWGELVPLVADGTVQTYRLSLDSNVSTMRMWEGPWTHLGIGAVNTADEETATIDILSVRVIPREAEFAGDRVGVRRERRAASAGAAPYRRTLYAHAPGRVAYRVRIPEEARLDVGLGVLSDNAPVAFTITAQRTGGEAEVLLEETYADQDQWGQRSVDLSHLAGQAVTLALETEASHASSPLGAAIPDALRDRVATGHRLRQKEKPNHRRFAGRKAGRLQRRSPALDATVGRSRAITDPGNRKCADAVFLSRFAAARLLGRRSNNSPSRCRVLVVEPRELDHRGAGGAVSPLRAGRRDLGPDGIA